MLEPDATARPSGAHGPPPTTFGPEALQILATEHWSLLASRSLAFALVLLPVVYFLGFVTIVRLGQVNFENALWVQGMNRIRHAYLQAAPELERYFVASRYDDEAGVLLSALAMRGPLPRLQTFVSIPGVVAVIDSVVAGVAAGIAAYALDLGVAGSVALGVVFFLLSAAFFATWARRVALPRGRALEPLFPTPPAPGAR